MNTLDKIFMCLHCMCFLSSALGGIIGILLCFSDSGGAEFRNSGRNLTFIGPCIAHIFPKYSQQDVTLLSLFISVQCSACFGWFFSPPSGAQNCTYSIRHLSDRYCYLLLAWPGKQQVAVMV